MVVWPAVIGHSCCEVPANVLSVCLFVFGENNKIRISPFISAITKIFFSGKLIYKSSRNFFPVFAVFPVG